MEKVCFMITPIGKEGSDVRKNADEVLDYIVNPICKEYGYSVVRADKSNYRADYNSRFGYCRFDWK